MTSLFDLLPLDGADQQNNSSAGASLIGWNGQSVGAILNSLTSSTTIVQVTNISAMRAIATNSVTNNQQILVANYTTSGDGGGGLFIWNSASTATHDFGMTFVPTANVSTVSSASIGTGDGSTTTFSGTLAHTSVIPKTFSIAASSQSASDSGNIGGAGPMQGSGGISGNINYATGAWTITFSTAPASGVAITASYSYASSAGRWLRVITNPINLAWFGLVNNPSIDNTSALMAFNSYARNNPNQEYEIFLPNGIISYQNPYFMQGIRNSRWVGGPATQFININTSGNTNEDFTSITNFDIFYDNSTIGLQNGVFNPGYTIATVPKFSTSVTLLTTANASNFTVGGYAFIYGYNQGSSGYPSACRYFEYIRVTAVNTSTGVLTLEKPLLNKYRQDWLDIQNNSPASAVGAARILPLNRPYFNITEDLKLENIIFGPSTYYATDPLQSLQGYLGTNGCLNVTISNCRVEGIFDPTTCQTVKVYNSYINFVEVDKNLDTVVFENCEIGDINNGPGTNFIYLKNCKIVTPIPNLGPRRFQADNCKFQCGDVTTFPRISSFIEFGASTPMDSISINDPLIDVIDPNEIIGQCPAQTGATTSQIILPTNASTVNNALCGYSVYIYSGTGVGQYRQISTTTGSYVGSTRTGTLTAAWTTQPDSTSVVQVSRAIAFMIGGGQQSVTVLSANQAANTIEVALTNAGLNDTTIRGLDSGAVLVSTTTATQIRISDIYYDSGTGNTVIAGQWSNSGLPISGTSGIPQVGEVFTANIVRSISVRNPVIKGSQVQYNATPTGAVAAGSLDIYNGVIADQYYLESPTRTNNTVRVPFVFLRDFTGTGAYQGLILGNLTKIIVEVSSAGTGTMTISRPTGEVKGSINPAPPSQVIDLTTTGVRVVDFSGTYGSVGADSLTKLTLMQYWHGFNIAFSADNTSSPPQGSILFEMTH